MEPKLQHIEANDLDNIYEKDISISNIKQQDGKCIVRVPFVELRDELHFQTKKTDKTSLEDEHLSEKETKSFQSEEKTLLQKELAFQKGLALIQHLPRVVNPTPLFSSRIIDSTHLTRIPHSTKVITPQTLGKQGLLSTLFMDEDVESNECENISSNYFQEKKRKIEISNEKQRKQTSYKNLMKLPETWKVFHVNKSAPAKKTSEREISKRRLIRNNSLKERKLASQQENTPQNEKENLEIIYEDCPEIVETVPNDTDDCSQKTQLSGFDERQEKNLHTDERAVENKDSNTNLEDLTPSDALQKNKGTSVVPKLLIHQNKNRIFEAVKNQFAEIEYSIDTNIEPKSSDNNEENCDFLPTIEEEKDTFQTRNIETDSEDSLDDYLRKDDSLDLIKDKVLTACQKIAEQNSITPSKVEALTSSISSSKDYEEENAEGSQDMADPLMSAKSSANSLTFTPSQMQTNKTPSSEESSKPRSSFYRPLYSSPLSQTSEWKSPINDAPPSTNKPNDITAEEDDHMNSFCNESYLPSLSSSSISVGESSYQPFPETLNSDSIADKSQQTSKRNCNNITTFLSSPSKKHNSYSSIHSRSPIFHDSPESENPESLPSPFAQTYQHPSSSEASADSGDDSLCEGTFSPCKDKKERRKKKKRKIKNHMKETEMQSRNILNDENTILSSSSSECSQLSSSSIFLDPSNASLCSLTSSPISPFRDLTPPLDRSTPISEMKQTSISSIAPSLRLSSSGFSSSSKAKPRTSHSKNTSLLDSPEIQQTNYIKSPTSISANVGSFNIPTTCSFHGNVPCDTSFSLSLYFRRNAILVSRCFTAWKTFVALQHSMNTEEQNKFQKTTNIAQKNNQLKKMESVENRNETEAQSHELLNREENKPSNEASFDPAYFYKSCLMRKVLNKWSIFHRENIADVKEKRRLSRLSEMLKTARLRVKTKQMFIKWLHSATSLRYRKDKEINKCSMLLKSSFFGWLNYAQTRRRCRESARELTRRRMNGFQQVKDLSQKQNHLFRPFLQSFGTATSNYAFHEYQRLSSEKRQKSWKFSSKLKRLLFEEEEGDELNRMNSCRSFNCDYLRRRSDKNMQGLWYPTLIFGWWIHLSRAHFLSKVYCISRIKIQAFKHWQTCTDEMRIEKQISIKALEWRRWFKLQLTFQSWKDRTKKHNKRRDTVLFYLNSKKFDLLASIFIKWKRTALLRCRVKEQASSLMQIRTESLRKKIIINWKSCAMQHQKDEYAIQNFQEKKNHSALLKAFLTWKQLTKENERKRRVAEIWYFIRQRELAKDAFKRILLCTLIKKKAFLCWKMCSFQSKWKLEMQNTAQNTREQRIIENRKEMLKQWRNLTLSIHHYHFHRKQQFFNYWAFMLQEKRRKEEISEEIFFRKCSDRQRNIFKKWKAYASERAELRFALEREKCKKENLIKERCFTEWKETSQKLRQEHELKSRLMLKCLEIKRERYLQKGWKSWIDAKVKNQIGTHPQNDCRASNSKVKERKSKASKIEIQAPINLSQAQHINEHSTPSSKYLSALNKFVHSESKNQNISKRQARLSSAPKKELQAKPQIRQETPGKKIRQTEFDCSSHLDATRAPVHSSVACEMQNPTNYANKLSHINLPQKTYSYS